VTTAPGSPAADARRTSRLGRVVLRSLVGVAIPRTTRNWLTTPAQLRRENDQLRDTVIDAVAKSTIHSPERYDSLHDALLNCAVDGGDSDVYIAALMLAALWRLREHQMFAPTDADARCRRRAADAVDAAAVAAVLDRNHWLRTAAAGLTFEERDLLVRYALAELGTSALVTHLRRADTPPTRWHRLLYVVRLTRSCAGDYALLVLVPVVVAWRWLSNHLDVVRRANRLARRATLATTLVGAVVAHQALGGAPLPGSAPGSPTRSHQPVSSAVAGGSPPARTTPRWVIASSHPASGPPATTGSPSDPMFNTPSSPDAAAASPVTEGTVTVCVPAAPHAALCAAVASASAAPHPLP